MRLRLLLMVFLLTALPGLAKPGKVLIVVSSAREIAGHPTGVWLEEFAVAYNRLVEAGYSVVVASPLGGECVCDSRSLAKIDVKPFLKAKARLKDTVALDSVGANDFAAIYLPGGHAPLVDLAGDLRVGRLVVAFARDNKPVASVCHGPAAFLTAKDEDGKDWVGGRRMTCFSNSEEAAGPLAKSVPFLLESQLKKRGATVEVGPNFQPKVVVDGILITGQNPGSSHLVAEALLELLAVPHN